MALKLLCAAQQRCVVTAQMRPPCEFRASSQKCTWKFSETGSSLGGIGYHGNISPVLDTSLFFYMETYFRFDLSPLGLCFENSSAHFVGPHVILFRNGFLVQLSFFISTKVKDVQV